MSATSWKSLREDFHHFQSTIAMRGLADYIVHAFASHDQDKIIEALTNPKLQAHVELNISFTERKNHEKDARNDRFT